MLETSSTVTQDPGTSLRAAAAGNGDGLRRGPWVGFLGPYGLEVATGCGADWVCVDLRTAHVAPASAGRRSV